TQTEFSFQFRIRQIDIAPAHHSLQQGEIELIALLLARAVSDQVAETDGAQFDWPNQFESGVSLNCSGQPLRLVEIQANGVAKGLQAVESQRKPKLQRAEAAREFRRFFKKCESLDRVRAELLGVSPGASESFSSDLGIAIK